MREEARPVVLGAASDPGEHGAGDDLLTSDSEDSTLVTSDEGEGEEPGRSRLCMQMRPAYTVRLGVYSDSSEERVDEKNRVLASTGAATARQRDWRSHSACHWLLLLAAGR